MSVEHGSQFQQLVEALQAYCGKLRDDLGKEDAAHKVRRISVNLLPQLTSTEFISGGDPPDVIFVESLLGQAVVHANKSVLIVLWEDYFLLGSSKYDVERTTGYSRGSIDVFIKGFPQRVASSLWQLERQIAAPPDALPPAETLLQRTRIGILQEGYGLSTRQSEVFLSFIQSQLPGPRLTRKEIAKALYITQNTLKRHVSNILSKVGAESMADAVEEALSLLRENPNARWPEATH